MARHGEIDLPLRLAVQFLPPCQGGLAVGFGAATFGRLTVSGDALVGKGFEQIEVERVGRVVGRASGGDGRGCYGSAICDGGAYGAKFGFDVGDHARASHVGMVVVVQRELWDGGSAATIGRV